MCECVCEFSWCSQCSVPGIQSFSVLFLTSSFVSNLSPVSEVNRNGGGVGADCWCRGNVLVFREFQNSIVTVVTIVSEAQYGSVRDYERILTSVFVSSDFVDYLKSRSYFV